MAESRQIPNESDLDGKRLNRGNFLRRTELLRRIHWKTWMLLVSFAAYGVLPFAAVQFSTRQEISTSSFVNSAGSGRHRKYRRRTLLFFLTGYILTGVWMIFLTSDLCYLRSDGVWRSFSLEAILLSGLFAVITGFLPPLVCFPLKFYSWKLAWGALTTLFLGGLLFTIFHVNTPEQIFRNRFGALAAEVRLEALKVSNSYESSCEIYKLSGDTKKILTALETLFSNETPRESFDTRFLPDWMLAEIPVKNPLPVLEFSIYFRTWSDGQYFYIWFNTWEYHGLTQWEAKAAPSRPAEEK